MASVMPVMCHYFFFLYYSFVFYMEKKGSLLQDLRRRIIFVGFLAV
jgi:hypothetical protein